MEGLLIGNFSKFTCIEMEEITMTEFWEAASLVQDDICNGRTNGFGIRSEEVDDQLNFKGIMWIGV